MAARLSLAGIRPNTISVLSTVFAAVASACLVLAGGSEGLPRGVLLLGAAAAIQLRLLCNLFDGMVAVEGGLKTKSGEIFNDLPDRVSDSLIFVAAGHGIPVIGFGVELGWVAALLAVLTAYVRLLGGSAGLPQRFTGPMAKPHRMAVMTGACLLAIPEPWAGLDGEVLASVLVAVILGSLVTIVRRTRDIVRELETR
jgi:phosphatidylglycerophosphate synthase